VTGIIDVATALYFACVDFLVHTANLTGLTYRDTNAALFFLVWPAVTVGLLALAAWQARALRRLRKLHNPRMRSG